MAEETKPSIKESFLQRVADQLGRISKDAMSRVATGQELQLPAPSSVDTSFVEERDAIDNATSKQKPRYNLKRLPQQRIVGDLKILIPNISTGDELVDDALQQSQDAIVVAIEQTHTTLKDQVGTLQKSLQILDSNVKTVSKRVELLPSQDDVQALESRLKRLETKRDYSPRFATIDSKKNLTDTHARQNQQDDDDGFDWGTAAGGAGGLGLLFRKKLAALGGKFKNLPKSVPGTSALSLGRLGVFGGAAGGAYSMYRRFNSGGLSNLLPNPFETAYELFTGGFYDEKRIKKMQGWGEENKTEDSDLAYEEGTKQVDGLRALEIERTDIRLIAKENLRLTATKEIEMKARKIIIDANDIIFKGKVTGLGKDDGEAASEDPMNPKAAGYWNGIPLTEGAANFMSSMGLGVTDSGGLPYLGFGDYSMPGGSSRGSSRGGGPGGDSGPPLPPELSAQNQAAFEALSKGQVSASDPSMAQFAKMTPEALGRLGIQSVTGKDGQTYYRLAPTATDKMTDAQIAATMAKPDISGKDYDKKSAALMHRLINEKGLTPEQAAGVVGNLGHESVGLQPGIVEGGSGIGRGWAQWSFSRRKEFDKFVRNEYDGQYTDEANYDFMMQEIEKDYPGLWDKLKAAKNEEEAQHIFHDVYEKSGDKKNGRIVKQGHWNSRTDYTKRALSAYGDGSQFVMDPKNVTPEQLAAQRENLKKADLSKLNMNWREFFGQTTSGSLGDAGIDSQEQWGKLKDLGGVDPRIAEISRVAAEEFPLRVRAFSGKAGRSSGGHSRGIALDDQIFDENGVPIASYQTPGSADIYAMWAEKKREVQRRLYPELNDQYIWGGGWAGKFGPGGKYGAGDWMDSRIGSESTMRAYKYGQGWQPGHEWMRDGSYLGLDKKPGEAYTPEDYEKLYGFKLTPEQIAEQEKIARIGGTKGSFNAGYLGQPHIGPRQEEVIKPGENEIIEPTKTADHQIETTGKNIENQIMPKDGLKTPGFKPKDPADQFKLVGQGGEDIPAWQTYDSGITARIGTEGVLPSGGIYDNTNQLQLPRIAAMPQMNVPPLPSAPAPQQPVVAPGTTTMAAPDAPVIKAEDVSMKSPKGVENADASVTKAPAPPPPNLDPPKKTESKSSGGEKKTADSQPSKSEAGGTKQESKKSPSTPYPATNRRPSVGDQGDGSQGRGSADNCHICDF